ncbi:MAG: glycosyl hydrolase family 5 [Pseudopedobacter saltans]|uniref:Glycosyl hydrolase family 5 n=1 Tax=Pseudopedobacter saltans TaxID=151895 RepID=A0A2W5EMQ3_9SPHI|nr:MAG: glycosyl hydrolase family 5 [Pseudopedobacter saltans]
MKNLIFKNLFLIICFIPFIGFSQKNQFSIGKGTNISGWLSQVNTRSGSTDLYFKEADIAYIKKAGFDFIRLPIDEDQMWDEHNIPNAESFKRLHRAIDWCSKYKLKIVLDLHILRKRNLWTSNIEQEHFINIWNKISDELSHYSNNFIAYELLNEPEADNSTNWNHENWNQLLERTISSIRKKEPNRAIVIGSNMWQATYTFQFLRLPVNKANIILSFHFYSPMFFTHYKAGWSNFKNYYGPIHYPDSTITKNDWRNMSASNKLIFKYALKPYSKVEMENEIKLAINVAKKYGVPVNCGEFGCLSNTPAKDRIQWYKDVISILNTNKISWSVWDYNSNGFGWSTDSSSDDLLKVMME